MGIKKGPKRGQKNTILTQLKNVQINVQEFYSPKFCKKNDYFDTTIFVSTCAVVPEILENHFFYFCLKQGKER